MDPIAKHELAKLHKNVDVGLVLSNVSHFAEHLQTNF